MEKKLNVKNLFISQRVIAFLVLVALFAFFGLFGNNFLTSYTVNHEYRRF